jgi:hypothetical protein
VTAEASRGDHLSYRNWLIVALLPLLTLILPAVLGHPPVLGDNATQNISLRWLVAQDYRGGHLPSWDPFNWDGTPLLAGFNAGALYPLMLLFILLPASVAMTLTLALCWLLAEVVVAKIAEAIGVSRWFAIAAGVVFVGTGAFTAQVVHIDMIEGDLASLFALLFLLRLIDASSRRTRIINAVGLAISFACAIFAGAPEAMLAGLVALGILFVVRICYRSLGLGALIATAVAATLALGLSAPQWLTGLAYTALSNRAHLPAHYAGVGPFGYRFLPLILFPFAYGGYSGGYLPNYFGNYNPSEITIAITAVGLTFAIVGIATRHLTTIKPWAKTFLVTLMIAAALLALGSNTPVAILIYHLPLFNLQRLASRYIIDIDLGGVLLAAAGAEYFWNSGHIRPLTRLTAYLLSLLGLVTLVVGVAIEVAPRYVFRLVSASSVPSGGVLLEIRLYLIIEIVVTVVVISVLLWPNLAVLAPTFAGRSPSIHTIRKVLIAALSFQMLGMAIQFVVLPSFFEPEGNSKPPAASQLIRGSERYGLYDPKLYLYSRAIFANEQPDRNVFTHTNSIQGYASLSLATFNDLTQTKIQSTLNPSLISLYHQRLNLDLLITSRRYLRVPIDLMTPKVLASHTHRPVMQPRGASAFFVGDISGAKTILLHPGAGVSSMQVIAKTLTGKTFIATEAKVQTNGWATINLPRSFSSKVLVSVAVRARSPLTQARRFDMVIDAGTQELDITGPLVNHLSPMEWRSFQGKYSSIDFASLHPTSGLLRANSTVTILSQHQATDGTITARLDIKRSSTITTTLAYAPGWKASTNNGQHVRIVNQDGLIALKAPKGVISLMIAYTVPNIHISLILGALSGLILLGFASFAWIDRRRTI